jgi:hypothetical protein
MRVKCFLSDSVYCWEEGEFRTLEHYIDRHYKGNRKLTNRVVSTDDVLQKSILRGNESSPSTRHLTSISPYLVFTSVVFLLFCELWSALKCFDVFWSEMMIFSNRCRLWRSQYLLNYLECQCLAQRFPCQTPQGVRRNRIVTVTVYTTHRQKQQYSDDIFSWRKPRDSEILRFLPVFFFSDWIDRQTQAIYIIYSLAFRRFSLC